ncbi:hypothetical protein [Actinopolymorpha cephalotaxi]|uniref:Peptidase n=1 Tax=Actinopolymorpha cephalotaxi TaxID=504797 RepID=A0ABX2RVP7_9ACTN|nr:hypothetical protein [Actinopolymorpha cephalotaxi]NYH81438.1 hypothetical protein [Actinopolymorpha cephalotaxi]
MRLLEAPVNRVDDPRARIYIVDHVNPGTTFRRKFLVSSTSPRPHVVTIYAAAAAIRRDAFIFAAGHTSNELSSWINVDKPKLRLPPHGQAVVEATISVPKEASEGERYAVIWTQMKSPKAQANENVSLVNRVGIRVYLDVGPGGEPPSNFKVNRVVPERTESGLPEIVADVTNTGKRALDLSGELWLDHGPGSLRAGPFPVDEGTTLAPGNRGSVTVRLDERLPNGPWKFRLKLRSGETEHTTTGDVTFPATRGTFGLPATLSAPLPLALLSTGALGVVGVSVLGFVGLRRFRARP